MYIEPNTTIRLIRNCPLDTTQEHTLWFNSLDEQLSYFSSLDGVNFLKQTYQRYDRGVLRVQAIADNIYDCNYLMFKNEGFKTNGGKGKWFYAFIKSVNYVNNTTSEIEYIIDDMQTWLFDYSLGECFVEREHSETDEIGENLVPEGLETGEYYSHIEGLFNGVIPELSTYSICVASTVKKNGDEIVDSDGEIYNGIFSGLTLTSFPMNSDGVTAYRDFMKSLTKEAKTEGITSVFLIPTILTRNRGDTFFHAYNEKKYYGVVRTNGKSPNNKKLYTYPYCFLYVTNLQGVAASFPYEYFDNDECTFSYFGDYSPSPSVVLAPIHYKGLDWNLDEKMTLEAYPQLAYNIDTFKAWLAQNRGTLAMNAIATGVNYIQNSKNNLMNTAIGAITSPTEIGAITSAVKGAQEQYNNQVNTALEIGNQLASIYDKSLMPNQAKGGGSTLALASVNEINFKFIHRFIRPEFVDIIDDYFTMYGYATHKVKIPNRNVRPHWTYIKTKGCVVRGSVPAEAMRSICLTYDRGITFWKNPDEVGQYHLDNRPI